MRINKKLKGNSWEKVKILNERGKKIIMKKRKERNWF